MGKPRGIPQKKTRPFNNLLFKQMVFHLENSLEVIPTAVYKCLSCGARGGLHSFRGASEDGSYLKCFICGSTNIVKIEEDEEEV